MIDPSMLTTGAEWSVGAAPSASPAGATSGSGFGEALGNQLEALQSTQNEASEASRALATGTATDPTQAILALDQARFAMQLASTVRTKAVESVQEIMRTQV